MRKLILPIILLILAGGAAMPSIAATDYTEHFFIFVEANKLNTANNFAQNWDPDVGGSDTFGSVRLSPTGEEPPTHYATSTRATETMRSGITQALGGASWATLYKTDDILAAEPHWYEVGGDWTFDGQLYSAWQSALNDMGLQRIVPPGP